MKEDHFGMLELFYQYQTLHYNKQRYFNSDFLG